MITKLLCVGAICAQLNGIPENSVIRGQRDAITLFEEISLSHECESMNAIGNIKTLLSQLDSYATELAQVNLKNPGREAQRVAELERKISQTTDAAKRILAPEWTTNKWPYHATWQLRAGDFVELPNEINKVFFKFRNFELSSIRLAGVERMDLDPLVAVTTNLESINVEITKTASSLELCQLQSSLNVGGVTSFWFENKKYYVNTTLQLRRGAIHKPDYHSPPVKFEPNPIDLDELKCRLLKHCDNDLIKDFIIGPRNPIGPIDPIEDPL